MCERDRETTYPLFIPQIAAIGRLVLVEARGQNSIRISHVGGRGPSTWAIFFAFSGMLVRSGSHAGQLGFKPVFQYRMLV